MCSSDLNFGGPGYAPPPAPKAGETRWHQHFGLLVASCDRADLRPQPDGVLIYGDRERRFEPLPPPRVHRAEVVNELHAAVFGGRAPLHDGKWAMATMEVCFALLQSAREGREVALNNQCGLPAGM